MSNEQLYRKVKTPTGGYSYEPVEQTQEENKSLPILKDKIAQAKGYDNWDDFFDWVAKAGEYPAVAAQCIESAMEEVLHEYRNLPNEPSIQEEGLEEAARSHASLNYVKAKRQSQDDVDYIQGVSFYSFKAGAEYIKQLNK